MREIVLDTETTGFDPRTGDRLIEVGCIEIEDLLPTGRTFHRFVNPERLIPPDAIKVHGITDDKVRDAPKFAEIVHDLMDFIGDATVIAHNAQFDRNFIDHECGRCGHPLLAETRWIDTLKLAEVYLELKGGKERVLDLTSRRSIESFGATAARGPRPHPLAPRSTEAEHASHLAFLKSSLKDLSLWQAYGLTVEDETQAA